MGGVRQRVQHHLLQPGQRVGQNLAGIVLSFQIGVAVQIIVRDPVENVVDKMPQKVRPRRRTKADRIGHAIRSNRDAIMGNTGRDIKDVAGFKHPFLKHFEFRQQLQIVMRQQRRFVVAALPDLPPASAKPLNQENIILVEMRANPALISGKADHHIVDAPIGNETERRDEIGDGGNMLVDCLHQQRPVRFAKFSQTFFALWPLLHFPSAGWLANQARLHFFLTGQTSKLVRLKRIVPARPGIADQQRLFLPIFAQEVIDVEIMKVHERAL